MKAVVRGCGTRVRGGIYAELPLGPEGRPVEDFLVDPPRPLDLEELGLSSIGVKLWTAPETGVTHVFDVVGQAHYPNVADFVEEVRRFGLSRRLARTVDFSKLTGASRLFLVHPRAYISNRIEYYADVEDRAPCPKAIAEHAARNAELGVFIAPDAMCAGLWWHDIEVPAAFPIPVDRSITRVMPSFTYRAHARPFGIRPERRPALFAAFPIAKLAIIRDPKQGTHEISEAVARQSELPVTIEDE